MEPKLSKEFEAELEKALSLCRGCKERYKRGCLTAETFRCELERAFRKGPWKFIFNSHLYISIKDNNILTGGNLNVYRRSMA